ncbi:hypothetical protein DFA_11257 [Cavenderia fasciculata]|uniref:peptidylprolyl isomerase n=1 Tax=Cavenderia fasciculata TaxID=261658 RepID=F4QFP3_CACFS|nr:uncharacterized protein DFA_11257 [Cavenderia fasciculata]EGG13496.1 hypothetical protein DFA_11257 [Cavenderia fasciculata]|eukprot:XP_004350200.1 hypothetical protein DFA_11257 [Cavenderia fasciculata]
MAFLLNHNFQVQLRNSQNASNQFPNYFGIQKSPPKKFVLNHFDDSYPLDMQPYRKPSDEDDYRYTSFTLNTGSSSNAVDEQLMKKEPVVLLSSSKKLLNSKLLKFNINIYNCEIMTDNNNTTDNEEVSFTCPPWATVPDFPAYLVTKDTNERIDLNKEKYLIFGRNKDHCNIVIDHPSVSRIHAALIYHGANNRFYLIDLQSSSGTYVNGEKIAVHAPASIKEDFTMRFGDDQKEFTLKGANLKQSSSSSSSSKSKKENSGLTKVQCRHLLVKHRESRNPRSWRQENEITRTKEEAMVKLQGYRDMITSGSHKFDELAHKYSDCSSAKRGGDLGFFTRGQMQKAFEDASFALQVGEMTEIVSTDSGVHIIERTA